MSGKQLHCTIELGRKLKPGLGSRYIAFLSHMRYYLAHGHGPNRPAQAKQARAGQTGPRRAWGMGHTSPRLRTAITQVSAGAGLLNFLVGIRDFDEPASR